jgi:uncharacterized membrane protein YgcG
MFFMRYLYFLLIPAALLASCTSSKKATAVSENDGQVPAFRSASITVDGRADDWKNDSLQLSPRGTVEYGMANDEKNIYIVLRIPDQAEQAKLLRGGMQVWIDPDGKKEKATEVIYPVRGELGESEKPLQITPGEKPNLTDMHHHIVTQLISLNRVGFKPEFTGVQSVRENTGFKAALGWNENEDLIYELQVPLAAFKQPVKTGQVQFGFFISGVERPKENAGQAAQWNAGGEGMGGGGRQGGGNYGGGRHNFGNRTAGRQTNNANNWQKMYQDENFWSTYTLAR